MLLLPAVPCRDDCAPYLTSLSFIPLCQPTCTNALPCGRAVVCVSKPTHALNAAGAFRRRSAPCGKTASPKKAAGCTPMPGTAGAPIPESPRYVRDRGAQRRLAQLGGGWLVDWEVEICSILSSG